MKRPQIMSINHYCMLPINSGGCKAIMDFYTALSRWCDIKLVAFSTDERYKEVFSVNEHFTIYFLQVPLESNIRKKEFYEKYNMNDSTIVDIAPVVMSYFYEDKSIIESVRKIGEFVDIVISEHIYTWNIIKKVFPQKRLWYRAHNVEYDYKIYDWRNIGIPQELVNEVYKVEEDACKNAEYILTISNEDLNRFVDLYDVGDRKENFWNLSAGYFLEEDTFVDMYEREKENKESYIGFYIGTDSPGAKKVVEKCVDVAVNCEDISFVIAGSVGNSFIEKKYPSNVLFLGVISEEEKTKYLRCCDFAINIIDEGSGVNIKMFEYFAYGIPVIASEHGVRGIDIKNKIECLITDNDSFANTIYELKNMPIAKINEMVCNAYELLRERYSWQTIAQKTMELVLKGKRSFLDDYDIPKSKVFSGKDYAETLKCCSSKIYIRCLGEWGKKCLEKLQNSKIVVYQCIDNKFCGNMKFRGVSVTSLNNVYIEDEDIIIVATEDYKTIVLELMENGVKREQIYLYGYYENKIFKLVTMEKEGPNYLKVVV